MFCINLIWIRSSRRKMIFWQSLALTKVLTTNEHLDDETEQHVTASLPNNRHVWHNGSIIFIWNVQVKREQLWPDSQRLKRCSNSRQSTHANKMTFERPTTTTDVKKSVDNDAQTSKQNVADINVAIFKMVHLHKARPLDAIKILFDVENWTDLLNVVRLSNLVTLLEL